MTDDIARLSRALKNADAAGDVAAAQKLAGALRQLQGQQPAQAPYRMEDGRVFAGTIRPQPAQRPTVAPEKREDAMGRLKEYMETGERYSPIQSESMFSMAGLIPARKDLVTGGLKVTNPDTGLPFAPSAAYELAENVSTAGKVISGEVPIRNESGNISDEVIARSLGMASVPVTGGAALGRVPTSHSFGVVASQEAKALSDEFGVPLTRGQATRDLPQQTFEESARHGVKGQAPQRTMTNFDAQQSGAIERSINELGDRIEPQGAGTAPADAAANAGRAVRTMAQANRDEGERLYKEAKRIGGIVSVDAVNGLRDRTRQVLSSENAMDGTRVRQDYAETRMIAQAIEDLADLKFEPPQFNANGGWGISYQRVEAIRQMINKKAPDARGGDRTALNAMRREIDSWFDDSIQNGLIAGDPKFLTALKGARAAWARYLKAHNSADANIKKMARAQANESEIAGWLFGSGQLPGGGKMAANTLRRMKELIGADHPDMLALRRAMFSRIMHGLTPDGQMTPGKLAANINSFFNSQNSSALAKEVFSPEEAATIKRFGKLLERIPADPKATNPPRSGFAILQQLRGSLPAVAGAAGYVGVGGGVPGVLAAIAAALGVAYGAARNTGKAVGSVNRPFLDGATAPKAGGSGRAAGALTVPATGAEVMREESTNQDQGRWIRG